ncbi:hypothetical protein Pint_30404 [Pistacia integerrima]|uniref:Uncharacterized protein n=1 Tax=Pistacia integerrima TaxID=434235 RepID=A0ACC0X021_9ROSI|nr:hypothetical protein Pint_30404 [Pistacia integerrima]
MCFFISFLFIFVTVFQRRGYEASWDSPVGALVNALGAIALGAPVGIQYVK